MVPHADPLPLASPAPGSPDAFYAAAVKAWRERRRDEAIGLMDEALRLRPDFAEALCMGGYMLGACGKPQAAMRFYARALDLDSTLAVAHVNLGKLLFGAGRFAEALASFMAATALAPEDADAWCSRAGALRELGRLEDSVEAAQRALALHADFPEAAINLGNALLKLDRGAEALQAYRRAGAAGPCLAQALLGQALALRGLGRFPEALAAFERAEALGSREAVAGKGCLMLTLGNFEQGLEGYEARWLKGKSLAETLGTRFPTWKGPGRGRERVLVLNDHGLGDTIQFFRYLPLMTASGVEATFVCPPRLTRLLTSSKARLRFADRPPERELFDAQIAISSLPHAFGTRLETIPASVPYLAAEPALRDLWRKRIGAEGFKIGLVWQGNPDPEADRARSMPLADFAPLARIAGVRLISLQKGAEDQLANLPPSMRVERLGADLDAGPDAFLDTAAAMTCLDLVVSCDTSAAHLAGALAVPVWVALKRDAEWRWLTGRADSPWYPTMRLFRQSRAGVWSDVFEAMAREVGPLSEGRTARRLVSAPCSLGELIDKITILRIKARRIVEADKLANVGRELAALEGLAREDATGPAIAGLTDQLVNVNARLWEIEDAIRTCEREGDFGPRFVRLARSVYRENDTRAAIKRAINTLAGSALIEEKSHG